MATFVLIHGAGDSASAWDLVAGELRERGHEVVAVDLPVEDKSAGLSEYADTVTEAIGDRSGWGSSRMRSTAATVRFSAGRRRWRSGWWATGTPGRGRALELSRGGRGGPVPTR